MKYTLLRDFANLNTFFLLELISSKYIIVLDKNKGVINNENIY
jgi:hypothetical protein